MKNNEEGSGTGARHSAIDWLGEYDAAHRHRANRLIHWVCTPLLAISVIGLLWSLPVPDTFGRISPALNWGTTFVMAAVVYYFVMSVTLGIGMVPVVGAMLILVDWLDTLAVSLRAICLALFVLAWAGQILGHRLGGERPFVLRDLQLLMIGPAWALACAYRKLGIPL